MKLLKRTFIATVALGSLVVLAGTAMDMNLNSTAFMKDSEFKAVKRLDDSRTRYVASALTNSVNKIDFPVNAENSELINGIWTITHYTKNFGKAEEYNANHGFELIGNGRVRVAGNDDLVYVMVEFDGTTLELVKEIDGGHEVLRAVKPVERVAEEVVVVEEEEEVVRRVQGLDIAEDMELVLVKAENPSKENKLSLAGNLEITVDGQILNFNLNGEELIAEDGEIKVGGLFNGEFEGETISGRISNNGSKDKFRVRIFTGKLAGVVLNFENVLTTEFDGTVAEENEEEAPEVEERREISVEEMDQVAEEAGFSF